MTLNDFVVRLRQELTELLLQSECKIELSTGMRKSLYRERAYTYKSALKIVDTLLKETRHEKKKAGV